MSFISLTKVLPAVLACAAPERFDALRWSSRSSRSAASGSAPAASCAMAQDRLDAFMSVARAARDASGCAVLGFASSGLPGPKGNLESFVWLAEPGRAGALDDDGIAAAAAAVEDPSVNGAA